jgi:hypothetical protein
MTQRAEQGPGGVSVDSALENALAEEDRDELADVQAALELLARLLLPEVSERDEQPTRAPQARGAA